MLDKKGEINMAENNCECPVGIPAVEQPVTHRFATTYRCERCGKYIIEDDTTFLFSDTAPGPKLKASLFWYLRIKENSGLKNKPIPLVFSSDWEEGVSGNYQFISTKYLLSIFPKNINEQINMILTNIASIIDFIGGEITVDLGEGKESFSIFIIDIDYTSYNAQKQLNEKINIFVDTELLKQTAVLGNNKVAYTLTPKAWNIVQNMQSKMNIPPQAFIAMWFDSSMTKARNVIRQAITDCGYLPVVIDEKEYNSFIVPEILYEIENSSFIIADFTGDRGGVYYEAGYAKGLRKEVIMTCKDGAFDPHFDTKQINHIVWRTENELYERLKKRINATIGSKANDTTRGYY